MDPEDSVGHVRKMPVLKPKLAAFHIVEAIQVLNVSRINITLKSIEAFLSKHFPAEVNQNPSIVKLHLNYCVACSYVILIQENGLYYYNLPEKIQENLDCVRIVPYTGPVPWCAVRCIITKIALIEEVQKQKSGVEAETILKSLHNLFMFINYSTRTLEESVLPLAIEKGKPFRI